MSLPSISTCSDWLNLGNDTNTALNTKICPQYYPDSGAPAREKIRIQKRKGRKKKKKEGKLESSLLNKYIHICRKIVYQNYGNGKGLIQPNMASDSSHFVSRLQNQNSCGDDNGPNILAPMYLSNESSGKTKPFQRQFQTAKN